MSKKRVCVSIRKDLKKTYDEVKEEYGFSKFVALCLFAFKNLKLFKEILEEHLRPERQNLRF